MTCRYAVIGNPIAHSRSPAIHAAFARQTGQDLVYERVLGRRDGFASDVRHFLAEGGCGLNVTLPFKEEAWSLCDELSPRAAAARAVNTLIPLTAEHLHGDNTDGIGLVRDLGRNHGFAFVGRRVLLLGAGGAARGVLLPLLETGLAELVIANRTAGKAYALAGAAESSGPVRGSGLDELAGAAFDLIVNATSAGLAGEGPALPGACLAPGGWAYDMVYGCAATPFLRWAQAQGAGAALDGFGMLVEQAAESFFLWRGVHPQTAEVIAELRGGD